MIPFIGTDDLAAALGKPVDENDLITVIALDSGCQTVRDFLQQDINYKADDVETIDGHGTKKIRLAQRPVRKLTEVKLDGQVVDPSLYNLKGSTIRRVDDIRWPVAYANIQVTYSHGYDVQPDQDSTDDVLVPATIRLVALLSAKRIYISVGTNQGILQSENIGSYSYTLGGQQVVESAAQLLDAEKAVLWPYKIILVPGR